MGVRIVAKLLQTDIDLGLFSAPGNYKGRNVTRKIRAVLNDEYMQHWMS